MTRRHSCVPAGREDQRVVAEAALVGVVGPFLLVAVDGVDRGVHVDEDLRRLLAAMDHHPDIVPDGVAGSVEFVDVAGPEAAEEVAGRRRVRAVFGAEQSPHRLALLEMRHVLDAGAAGEQAVGVREDVVGLEVAAVELPQRQRLVDALRDPQPRYQPRGQRQATDLGRVARSDRDREPRAAKRP